jgi:hypothetical protein
MAAVGFSLVHVSSGGHLPFRYYLFANLALSVSKIVNVNRVLRLDVFG